MRIIYLIFLIIINLNAFGFVVTDLVGGIATGLGGVVLDKDMGGFNSIYNQSSTVINMNKQMVFDFSVAYALAPYGIQGIDNAAFGSVFGYDLNFAKFGVGIGGQLNLVQEGINEYRFYLGGAFFYNDIKNILKFIDGLAISINSKIISFNTTYNFSDIQGFNNNPMSFDLDSDITISFLEDKIRVGVYILDILESSISFIGSVSNINKRQLFLHGKINIAKDFDFYSSINLLGTPHTVDRNNFLASSTIFANTYFGIEANFAQSIFVRIGLNEGKVTGGIGLKLANMDINFGVVPISTLNLYYQLDLTYKIF